MSHNLPTRAAIAGTATFCDALGRTDYASARNDPRNRTPCGALMSRRRAKRIWLMAEPCRTIRGQRS